MVNVRETWEMLQPNSLTSGMRNTLQAYPAPKRHLHAYASDCDPPTID